MNQENCKIILTGVVGSIGTITISELNVYIGFFTGIISLTLLVYNLVKTIKKDLSENGSRKDQ